MVNDTAKFLGIGIANLVNVFNPEAVVVCGGVTLAGDHLFVPLRREVARRAFKPAVSVCRIVPCELTGTAGVYGAAKTFLDQRRLKQSASSGRWSGTSFTAATRSRRRWRSGAGSPMRSPGLDASLTPDWQIVPLIKVGRDLSREAQQLLNGLSRLAPGGRCVEVTAPNNRVVLHYQSDRTALRAHGRRGPRVDLGRVGPHGAGPGRHLPELHLRFRAVPGHRAGAAAGLPGTHLRRPPQPLPWHAAGRHAGAPAAASRPDWFGCFDMIQLNEDEMRQLSPDPLSLSAQALGAGVSLLTVTLGPKGVAYVAAPGFERLGDRSGKRKERVRPALRSTGPGY